MFITVVVKNLVNVSLQHDPNWLNFTAVSDTQRTVGAR